jgi:hypothetical protein
MESEQLEEWRTLQKSAKAILRKGYTGNHPGSRVFQLLIIPSFTSAVSIEAYAQSEDTNDYWFVRMLWEWDKDYEKFRTPVERLRHPFPLSPTIKSEMLILKDIFPGRIIQKLRSVQIPAWVESKAIGLDGTMYELLLGEGYLEVRYSWWECPPTEWKPLAEIATSIQEFAEKIFIVA